MSSIAFLISACIWLFQAINYLNIMYDILAVANAILSVVNLYLYEKNKKQQ